MNAAPVIDQALLVSARKLAAHQYHRFNGTIPFEDFLSDAHLALVQAAAKFDPAKGRSFHNYAVRRVCGATLDTARAADPFTRRERNAIRRRRADPSAPLTPRMSRAVSEPRITVPMDVNDETERALLEIELYQQGNHGVPEARQLDPDQIKTCMIRALNAIEQIVVWQIVVEDRTAREIAQFLDFTPSRIGQLLKSGLRKLRLEYVSQS